MNRFLNVTFFFLVLSSICWAGGSNDRNTQPQTQQAVPQPAQPLVQQVQQQVAQPQVPSSPFFTGDGGKGMSIAILAPKASGLAENQSYLPTVVQGEFVSNFKGFSAIDVLDRERLDDQYRELESGYYDINSGAGQDFGQLSPTTHIMGGNITRTTTGYALQIQITRTADKTTTASYSKTFTFAELDDFSGIRRASMDLLQGMGITLTAKAREELTGAAAANQVTAQTALARGITAQRQGTEVAALSYYFQAAAYDPSLLEAVSRSSVLNANITSGNIGDNIRNDIQWRKDWVARLTETEQFFDSFNKKESMPYTLYYTNDIKQIGNTDYQKETAVIGGIETHLHGSGIWTLSIERALQTVYDGLDATKRKDAWGLGNWPRQGVTNLNVFSRRSQNFSVVFELINSQNKVIGRQTLQTIGLWELSWSGRPEFRVNADDRKTLNFQNVNANDITDNMTIRVVTVNGTAAETAARNGVLQIRASTKSEFDVNDMFRFSRGEIQGFSSNNARTTNLVIPGTIWGDPVISIANRAFRNSGLTSVVIPSSVTIGNEAFLDNRLTVLYIGANVAMSPSSFGGGFQFFHDIYIENGRQAGTYNQSEFLFVNGEIRGFANNADRTRDLVIPDTIWGKKVISIGEGAFKNAGLTGVDIPNSVTSIGKEAFANNKIRSYRLSRNITSIRDKAFYSAFDDGGSLSQINLPNITSIGDSAFANNDINGIITIGANARVADNAFTYYESETTFEGKYYPASYKNSYFARAYEKQGRMAGTYKFNVFAAKFAGEKGSSNCWSRSK